MKSKHRLPYQLFILSLFMCLCSQVCLAADLEHAQLGSHQSIPTFPNHEESGFLRYVGTHHDRRVVVLSFDIGSAGPSEDLRIYVQTGEFYHLVLGVPLLQFHGFRCKVDGDKLTVFIWTNMEAREPQPFMTLDLGELLAAIPKA